MISAKDFKDKDGNPASPEAAAAIANAKLAKQDHFWILMGESDDILLTKPSRIKNAAKYIPVVHCPEVSE